MMVVVVSEYDGHMHMVNCQLNTHRMLNCGRINQIHSDSLK